MNQYIITEEQLKKYEGLFFLDDDALHDFKVIRSHPYQSERDTVLDELLERFDDDTNYNGWYVRETLIEKLRQAGEP